MHVEFHDRHILRIFTMLARVFGGPRFTTYENLVHHIPQAFFEPDLQGDVIDGGEKAKSTKEMEDLKISLLKFGRDAIDPEPWDHLSGFTIHWLEKLGEAPDDSSKLVVLIFILNTLFRIDDSKGKDDSEGVESGSWNLSKSCECVLETFLNNIQEDIENKKMLCPSLQEVLDAVFQRIAQFSKPATCSHFSGWRECSSCFEIEYISYIICDLEEVARTRSVDAMSANIPGIVPERIREYVSRSYLPFSPRRCQWYLKDYLVERTR